MHGGSSSPFLGVSPRPRGALLQLSTVLGGGLLLWAGVGSVETRGGAVVRDPSPPCSLPWWLL
eukprot:6870058-Pyramimonas_sp.AAC.1